MIAAIRVYPSILYMLHNKFKRQGRSSEKKKKRGEPREMYQEMKNKKGKTRKRKEQGNPDNAAKSYARILLPSVHPNKKHPGIYLTVS